MKIVRLDLRGFASFPKGIDLRFSKDEANLVIGRNETGKSTILRGILAVIFGFKDIATIRRNRPWESHQSYSGSLELELDDGSQITITRDFANHRTEVIQQDQEGKRRRIYVGFAEPRSRSSDAVAYEHFLESVFAVRDEAIFRNTVFIGHQDLQTRMGDEVRRLLSGTSKQDYDSVLVELRARLARLAGSDGQPGLIRHTEGEVATARRNLTEARELLDDSREAEHRAVTQSEEMEGLDEELSWIQSEQKAYQQLLTLSERRALTKSNLNDRSARFSKLEATRKRIEAIHTTVRGNFAHFKNAPSETAELLRAKIAEAKELAATRHQLKKLGEARDANRRKAPVEEWIAGLLLGVGAGVGFATPLGIPKGILFGAVLGLVIGLMGRIARRGERRRHAEIERRIDAANAVRETQVRRVEDLQRRLGTALAQRDAAETLREYQQLEGLLKERREHRATLEALGDADEIHESLASARADHETVENAIASLVSDNPEIDPSLAHATIEARIAQLESRCNEVKKEREERRVDVDAVRAKASQLAARMTHDIARLEDEIRRGNHAVTRSHREHDALRIAIEELDSAVREFEDRDVFQLARETSQIFSKITAGKYDQVHLGPSLNPLVSKDDGKPIQPDDLSQGTQDQLYFALRIAMARHLARDVKLPLFLDDPFVNFDEARAEITKELVCNLDDHQVLLMTWDRAYEQWPGRIIDLDRFRKGEDAVARPSSVEVVQATPLTIPAAEESKGEEATEEAPQEAEAKEAAADA